MKPCLNRVLLLVAIIISVLSSNAQHSPTPIGALEAIRNIDILLESTKIEAKQAGRHVAYADQLNIARSLVHARKYGEALKAYESAVGIAWNRGAQDALLKEISAELDRLQDAESNALNASNVQGASLPSQGSMPQIDKYTAGNRIDSMLAFLHTDILSNTDDKLNLLGKLSDCRYLVELDLHAEALEAYHQAIIAYLDPKWTSQLLDDIDRTLKAVALHQSHAELHPDSPISKQDCKAEIDTLLLPLERRFGQNLKYHQAVDSMHYQLETLNREKVLGFFLSGTEGLAPKIWIDHTASRIEAQMKQCAAADSPHHVSLAVEENAAPILYFYEKQEGRTLETIRIMESKELMTYKRVLHDWGGVFHFTNDEATTDAEWLRVWELYERQQATTD